MMQFYLVIKEYPRSNLKTILGVNNDTVLEVRTKWEDLRGHSLETFAIDLT
jgi:hypothetical protein